MRVLEYLPLIEEGQNLEDLVAYEYRVEEAKKSPDYEKLRVFESFRKMRAEYMQKNKASY